MSRVDRLVYYPEDESFLFELAPEVRYLEVAVAE